MQTEITNNRLKINQFLKRETSQPYHNGKSWVSNFKKGSFFFATISAERILSLCVLEERKWDSHFFKRKMGAIKIYCFVGSTNGDLDKLFKSVLREAKNKDFKHLILRVENFNYNIMQIAEENKFILVDAGTVFTINEKKISGFSSFQDVNVREMHTSDLKYIQSYIVSLFKHSYFYRDHFFSNKEADSLFKTWSNTWICSRFKL